MYKNSRTISHKTQTWWEWSQTWLSCRAPQRWSLPPQLLASHRSSPPAGEEQIKRVRLVYIKKSTLLTIFHVYEFKLPGAGPCRCYFRFDHQPIKDIFKYSLWKWSTFQRYLNIIFLHIPYENDQPIKDIWISSFYIFLFKMIPYHNFFIIIMVYLLVEDTQAYLLL